MSLVARATRSRLAARLFFGVALPELEPGEHAFDVTSLALRRVLARRVPRGARVLDLGTGSAAILGLWLRRRGCEVACTELDPKLAARAREAVRVNGAAIPVRCASFFEGQGRADFDFVVFNPPYVPTGEGERRRLPERYRSQWDGGADGTATLAAFLEAFARDGGGATALVGLNRRHVPEARVRRLLAGREAPALREVWRHPWLPVDAYFFVRTKSPSASTSRPEE